MNILVDRSEITEFGIYKEAGAIVLGFKFPANATIHSLIVQIEEETSELARDKLGMYVELDGNAFYGGVIEFRYDDADARIRLELDPGKTGWISGLQIEIPPPLTADEQQLIRELARACGSSLRRSN